MPASRRERELARAKAQRQAARRAERRRRRRQRLLGIAAMVLVLVVVGVVTLIVRSGGSPSTTAATPAPSASSSPSAAPSLVPLAARPVACGSTAPPAPKAQTFAKEPALTVTSGTWTMTLRTSCGPVTVLLDAAKAPHTVNSLVFLSGRKFYDGTMCHRLVDAGSGAQGLHVLQCGDPKGTGAGGPGYTLPEENLKGATYPRGTLAMANTGAKHSTGSQFFLVDKDSGLPASYTVVGHVTAGISVLDRLAAVGTDSANGTGDGAPKQRIYLDTVTVAKA